jgi:tetraacyldisaccharide 4'-kinase
LAGDEPYLLAKETKAIVAVAKNRLFAARLALENGANFLVLDDGFQHLKLKRDVDILAAFGEKPFGEGWPLPAGPLRERLSAGQRAHLVIAGPKDPQNPWGKPQYAASLKFLGLRVLSDGTLANPEIVKKARVAAFAALARPGDFFKSLKEWGFRPVATLSFPDHAPYGPDKIRELAKFKLLAKVDYLLTTPKDSVKLGDLAPAVLAVETALVPGEPNRLLGEILALIPPKKLEA